MEEHPNRQPRRPVAMDGGDDDDRNADYEFKRERIDGGDLEGAEACFWGRFRC